MNTIRKIAPLLIVATLCLPFLSCRTVAAESTPQEIQAIPMSQVMLLDSAITSIEAGDANWVDESGNVLLNAILAVLRADKAAWAELDRFYNPTSAAPTAPSTE